MGYKEILGVVPTLQTATLVSSTRKKKKKLVGKATDIIVGSALISAESKMIGGL